MALKELEARYATKRSKDYKLADGEGLYLLVRPNGSKLWRMLTTNFDEVLSAAAEATFLLPRGLPFSDFYPWNARFAHGLVGKPGAGFGIWHINGTARHKRSIRLGLTDYMGSVRQAGKHFFLEAVGIKPDLGPAAAGHEGERGQRRHQPAQHGGW